MSEFELPRSWSGAGLRDRQSTLRRLPGGPKRGVPFAFRPLPESKPERRRTAAPERERETRARGPVVDPVMELRRVASDLRQQLQAARWGGRDLRRHAFGGGNLAARGISPVELDGIQRRTRGARGGGDWASDVARILRDAVGAEAAQQALAVLREMDRGLVERS